MTQSNPWTMKSSRVVYETPWFRIHEDEVTRPDGNPGYYSYMEVRPSVGVLAVNEAFEVALVGQWRYAIGRYTWEIVRGGADDGETDILAVAKRELLEETGFAADCWRSMGDVFTCTGLATDHQYFFAATDLHFTGAEEDAAEPLDLRWFPLDEAMRMVTSGEIVEVCSIAAILKFKLARSDADGRGAVNKEDLHGT